MKYKIVLVERRSQRSKRISFYEGSIQGAKVAASTAQSAYHHSNVTSLYSPDICDVYVLGEDKSIWRRAVNNYSDDYYDWYHFTKLDSEMLFVPALFDSPNESNTVKVTVSRGL